MFDASSRLQLTVWRVDIEGGSGSQQRVSKAASRGNTPDRMNSPSPENRGVSCAEPNSAQQFTESWVGAQVVKF